MAQSTHIYGIRSLSQSHVLAEHYAKNPNSLLLVIADSASESEQLANELALFTNHNANIAVFPDWEVLPYDHFSPADDLISERIKLLANLPTHQGIVIISAATLLQFLPPKSFIGNNNIHLQVGDQLDLNSTRYQLEQQGYHCVKEVMAHGEFAIRGSILDLFPTGSRYPFRLDLFDNEIETIRTFSVDTQRSIDNVDEMAIFTAKEFPFDDAARTHFLHQWEQQFDTASEHQTHYQSVVDGRVFNGIEFYFPLFFDQTETLFDYLPKNTTIAYKQNLSEYLQQAWNEINQHYEQKRHDIRHPLLPPTVLWQTQEALFNRLTSRPTIKLFEQSHNKHHTVKTNLLPKIAADYQKTDPFIRLREFKADYHGKLLLCAETIGRQEVVTDLLTKHQLPTFPINNIHEAIENCINITTADITRSLILEDIELCVISEPDLFNQRVNLANRRQKKTPDSDDNQSIKSLLEITIDDPVVHLEHGIGRYIGLHKIELNNQPAEFLTIEYANNDKLYVPVTSLHLISKYTAVNQATTPINRLGTDKWQKAKSKAYKKANDVAAELLEIYAKREAAKGVKMAFPSDTYESFCQRFPFEETADQSKAIQQVIADLTNSKPMDRVVCGDVGFGKTEVAMRATFITAMNGLQTIILVPTTLLAEQHGQNFKDRFSEWPVQVEVLSRFKTNKEQQTILDKLNDGTIDIIIGTHKLIQPGVNFNQPGLMIIDEEHRFGVKQKEQLKKYKATVNILTMTATPIPRTLNFALSALRDFSIIATPPKKRLSIKTFVHEYRHAIITEAIQRELHRGGQIYFVHNNVTTIAKITEELQQLFPDIGIQYAHGQMKERELEVIMADFYHRRFNLLVCTTIIETGIDIPTANTIIINRADKLGLAQLHQLRGRVGRSHHQAYAYLLTPDYNALTRDAKKRLDALASLGDLGSGLALATHDLEIRGAGEILGDEQSGQMQEIGFTLYMDILERAVNDLRAGKTPDAATLTPSTTIELNLPAIIPDDYLPDVHLRLQFYKRISAATTEEALNHLQVELIDRFGLLPIETKSLFASTELKLHAESLGINGIKATASTIKISFNEENKVRPETIIQLIQTKANTYKLHSPTDLHIVNREEAPEDRISLIQKHLQLLNRGIDPTKS